MQLEAIKEPIRYRLKTGQEVTLRPGVPQELPDPAAAHLLKKAPDKVRLVSKNSAIQPGTIITWQGADLSLRGPAEVDFLYVDADGTCWAFVTLPDGWAAVNLKYARTDADSQT